MTSFPVFVPALPSGGSDMSNMTPGVTFDVSDMTSNVTDLTVDVTTSTSPRQWSIFGHFSTMSEVIWGFSGALATLTSVLGIPANLLVCYAVYRTKSLRTSLNALVVNLMLADVITCAVLCPLVVVFAVVQSAPSNVVCRLFDFSHVVAGSVQLITMAFLSFERYQAIRRPFDAAQRLSRVRISLIICWVIALLLGGVSAAMTTSPVLQLCSQPAVPGHRRYEFGLYVFVPLCLAAIAAIVGFYAGIVSQISTHLKSREKRLAWRRKVNKIEPVLSVTLSLVKASASLTPTTPLPESSSVGSSGGTTAEEAGRRSRERNSRLRRHASPNTSISNVPSPFSVSPLEVVRRKSASPAFLRRRTKSETDTSMTTPIRMPLNIAPKFSQDSHARRHRLATGGTPAGGGSKVVASIQGFLIPPASDRRRCYYHSDSDIANTRSTDENSGQGASDRSAGGHSDPVTFTALESVEPGEVKVAEDLSNVGGSCPPGTSTSRANLQKERSTSGVETTAGDRQMGGSSRENREGLQTEKQGNPTQEGEAEVPSRPKRPTRRTAVVDVIRVHDFDGVTMKAKVKADDSRAIVGDVCVVNRDSREQGKRRVEQRTAKRTAVIVVAFLCCWMPLLVVIMVSPVLERASDAAVRVWCEAYIVTMTLALVAGVVNPVVYGVINNQFRTALLRILKAFKSHWCKKRD